MGRKISQLIKSLDNGIPFSEQLKYGLTDFKPYDYPVEKINELFEWFRSKYEMICRIFYYGWKMRNSYDFDGHALYGVIYLKLDAMYRCFRDHGHCVWNRNKNTVSMRRIRIARELARRLDEGDYFSRALIPHDKKWGTSEVKFKNGKGIFIIYENAKNYEQQEQARDEMLLYYNKAEEQIQTEHKELFRLLEKYLQGWWD
jgi:hypothetical protein